MDEHLSDIDDLFQNAVKRHSEIPTGNVWSFLEKNLQKRSINIITGKYKKWKRMAAIFFILFIGLGVYTIRLTLQYKTVTKENHAAGDNDDSGSFSQKSIKDYGLHLNQKAPGNTGSPATANQKKLDENNFKYSLPLHKNPATILKGTPGTSATKVASGNSHKLHQEMAISRLHGIDSLPAETRAEVNTSRQLNRLALIKKESFNLKNLATNNATGKITGRDTSKYEGDTSIGAGTALKGNAALFSKSPVEQVPDLKTSLILEPENLSAIKPLVILAPGLHQSIVFNNDQAKTAVRLTAKSLQPGKFTAGIFYGKNRVYTDLTVNRPDFREDNYLQIINHEKNKVSTITGLSVAGNIWKQLAVRSGISVATYITDITRKPLVARRDNNGKINYRISTSSGYAYFLVKNRPQPSLADSIQTLSSKSTLKYVSVPVGLQYSFFIGRFSLAPSISVNANFRSTAKIITIQSLERTYTGNIEGLKPCYFDGNIGLGISYYLNKIISVSFIPAGRWALSTATGRNPVVTRRNSVGLAGGVNFSF